jgi:hypothetical protein
MLNVVFPEGAQQYPSAQEIRNEQNKHPLLKQRTFPQIISKLQHIKKLGNQ